MFKSLLRFVPSIVGYLFLVVLLVICINQRFAIDQLHQALYSNRTISDSLSTEVERLKTENSQQKGNCDQLVQYLENEYGLISDDSKRYEVSVDISPDKKDRTISRKAMCDLPKKVSDRYAALPVVIKHYRNGKYIPMERPDYIRTMHIRKGIKIKVQGQLVDEYEFFHQAYQTIPITQLIAQCLLMEDQRGNLNKLQ